MRAPGVLLLLLAACNGPSVTPLFVEIVTPSGANPLASGAGATHVHVDLRMGTGAPTSFDDDAMGATFMHDWPITDLTARTSTRVTLTLAGGAGTLIGAAPDFVPNATTGVIKLPVGPPGTCATVAGTTFATPRVRPTAMVMDGVPTFPLVAGEGVSLEIVDLLALAVSTAATDTWTTTSDVRLVPLGTNAAFALSTTSDIGASYVFHTDATMRQHAVAVHAGAHLGTPISFDATRVAILGGADATGPVDSITLAGLMASDITSSHLLHPRQAPAALVLGERILIAGGAESDTTNTRIAELDTPTSGSGMIGSAILTTGFVGGGGDGIRRGGVLFTDGRAVLLVGGTDEMGNARHETVLFTGCPDTCMAMPGPRFDDAREGMTAVALPTGGLLVGGSVLGTPSDHVTQVTFVAGAPTFTTSHLATGRASPAAFAVPSGLVYVVQGQGGETSMEVCFPDVLTPLL